MNTTKESIKSETTTEHILKAGASSSQLMIGRENGSQQVSLSGLVVGGKRESPGQKSARKSEKICSACVSALMFANGQVDFFPLSLLCL